MLLNLYYKLMWWYAKAAANVTANGKGYITIPNTVFADGNLYNSLYWGHYEGYRSALTHGLLVRPYMGMKSQADTPEQFYVGDGYNACYSNFIVGSGATPVTGDDYQVEKEIVNGLTCEAITVQTDDEARTVTYRKTLYNASQKDITIAEVGLTGPVCLQNSMKQALIYREVLQTPVTLAPGESATLRITVAHEYPA